MAEHQLTCVTCGAQFTFHRRKKYCSTKCRRSVILAPARKRERLGIKPRWEDGTPACHKEHECWVCGIAFKPKRAGRTKTCGTKCGHTWAGTKSILNRTGGRVWVRTKIRIEPKPIQDFPPAPQWCRSCGAGYYRAKRYQRYCNDECGAADREAQKKAASKAAKSRRKAIQRGANGGEAVNPIKVFERDGWRCQMCRKKTPKRLRGTHEDRAPELDHIQPVSKGGEHTYRNTQCLCRSCNAAKSDRPMGQLSLI